MALQRPCAVFFVVALCDYQVEHVLIDIHRQATSNDAFSFEYTAQFGLRDFLHFLFRESQEPDDVLEAVEQLWSEHCFELDLQATAFFARRPAREAGRSPRQCLGAHVGGSDDNSIPEVDRGAACRRKVAIVEKLK